MWFDLLLASLFTKHFFSKPENFKSPVCQVASVVSNSLWSRRLKPARLLCSWDFLCKNTGLGCHVLLQSPGKLKNWISATLLYNIHTLTNRVRLLRDKVGEFVQKVSKFRIIWDSGVSSSQTEIWGNAIWTINPLDQFLPWDTRSLALLVLKKSSCPQERRGAVVPLIHCSFWHPRWFHFTKKVNTCKTCKQLKVFIKSLFSLFSSHQSSDH